MAAKKEVIISFIVSELGKATPTSKIMELCGTKWDLSRSAFFRTLKKAQEQHIQSQQAIKDAVKDIEVAGAVEAAKRAVMTAVERKELLTKIALGEVKIPTNKYQYDSKIGAWMDIDVLELPDHQARIKAIAELNKMEGDYSPIKTDVSLSQKPTVITPGDEI
jgi:hypothetical protein